MVPNVSLADLLDLSQYGLSVSSVENGQYPMFKMNNFRNGFMSEKGVDTVNLDETEFDKYRLEYGDILFNRTNSIDLVGKTGIFTLEGDYVFASYLVRLKVNRDIADPFYLNYFMNFDATKLRLRSLATKAVSQANINPTQLKKLLKVPLLPLSEQRKIAQILSTWDKAIATTEKLIDTSKQQKKALMQQLLTGKKRLVNPETGKAFEGEWERHAMSDLAFIDRKSLGKKTPDDFKFQYISLSDVAVGSISKELEVHKFASAPSRARRVIQEGDILLSTVRPNLKGFAKVSGNHADCIASTGFSVLTPKKRVSGDYIYQYIFSSHVTGQIDSLVVGSNYPAINSSDVAGLKVYCPTYEEQQKIASVLTTADKEIEVLEAKLDHLKDEKKALMQQLLTGKRRVKVEEMEVA
ncbi:restriction endonuclease subunit S [Vibrio alginolyticus]|uniref:restriction endonuclease subunit S n=1 Tax=Vibrio alginolyticus TaxID=663 RepID=UPI003F67E586